MDLHDEVIKSINRDFAEQQTQIDRSLLAIANLQKKVTQLAEILEDALAEQEKDNE